MMDRLIRLLFALPAPRTDSPRARQIDQAVDRFRAGVDGELMKLRLELLEAAEEAAERVERPKHDS